MNLNTKHLHWSELLCCRQWQSIPLWLLTAFVNHLFPWTSLIRGLQLWNTNYYSCWWMKITFLLIATLPIFTTSQCSPRPLSTTTCTNWADYCKMCVLVCVLRWLAMCCGIQDWDVAFIVEGCYIHWPDTNRARSWLVSFFLDRHPNVKREFIKARTSVSILVKGDMNEGLSNNWLFTFTLLPQRPGLSYSARRISPNHTSKQQTGVVMED